MPVSGVQVEAMFSLMREGVDVARAGWMAGVPTCNLHAHPQWQAFEADRVKAEAAQEVQSRSRWERHAVVALEALEGQLRALRHTCDQPHPASECGILQNLQQAAAGAACECHPHPESHA